jgi:two-component system cell cycle response regulator
MDRDKDLASRLEAAERQLEALTGQVARNEDKMRRTQQREIRLLQADDLETLFREMLLGLRASYGLEYVSVVLCDPDHDIRHLLLAAGTPASDFENLVMVESMTGLAPQYVALRHPWLGAYAACDHQLICPGARGLQSIAIS